jgi:hypothetical protein
LWASVRRHNPTKPQVICRGINGLRQARRGPLSPAVVLRAHVRAAFHSFRGRRRAGGTGIEPGDLCRVKADDIMPRSAGQRNQEGSRRGPMPSRCQTGQAAISSRVVPAFHSIRSCRTKTSASHPWSRVQVAQGQHPVGGSKGFPHSGQFGMLDSSTTPSPFPG